MAKVLVTPYVTQKGPSILIKTNQVAEKRQNSRRLKRTTPKKLLTSSNPTTHVAINETDQVRYLCLSLILQAVVSYRSVPRILGLFNTQSPLSLTWIPHFTSVINWTLRLGLGMLKQVKPVDHSWLAIIDHSIDIGTKKVLVVLRVPMDTLSKKEKAIGLKECECLDSTAKCNSVGWSKEG